MKKFLLALTFLTILSADVHAYLDGGSGSMLLQLLLGGAAGGIAVVKIYWHRIKSFFCKDKNGEK
jgi:hypothetical protein